MAKKKRTETKVVQEQQAKIVKDQHGNDNFIVIESKDYFTFTNMRRGMFFFKREDGKEDFYQGKETKSDITQKERDMFLGTVDYSNGWLIEETDKEDVTEESIYNKNALSDSRLKKYLEDNKSDIEKIKNFITEMSSDFALKRMKDAILDQNMPSSLLVFCDFRIKELEEAYLESKKAPMDKDEIE